MPKPGPVNPLIGTPDKKRRFQFGFQLADCIGLGNLAEISQLRQRHILIPSVVGHLSMPERKYIPADTEQKIEYAQYSN